MSEFEDRKPNEEPRQANKKFYSPYSVLDNRLMVRDQVPYSIPHGPARIAFYKVKSPNDGGNSSSSFDVSGIGWTNIVPRVLLLDVEFTVTVTGVPAAGQYLVDWGRNIALAPFPVASMMKILNLGMNTDAISVDMEKSLDALLRICDDKVVNEVSTVPTMLDQCKLYAEAAGTIFDPLSGYANAAGFNLGSSSIPRGAWAPVSIDDAANTVGDGTAVKNVDVTFKLTEPLFISPLLLSDSAPSSVYGGFGQLSSMNVNVNWVSGAGKCRALRSSIPGATCTLKVITNSYLRYQKLSPQDGMLLPRRVVHPYVNVDTVAYSIGLITAGSTFSSGSNQQELPRVPDYLLMGVRKKYDLRTCADSDYWLAPNDADWKVSVDWMGNTYFTNTTIAQLYQMSRDNGLRANWLNFSGAAVMSNTRTDPPTTVQMAGAPILLRFGKDIPLASSFVAPNVDGSYSFSTSVSGTNNGTTDENLELVVMFLYSKLLVNSQGASTTMTGFLTEDEVDESNKAYMTSPPMLERLYGSGYMGAGFGGSSCGRMYKRMGRGSSKSTLASVASSVPSARDLKNRIRSYGKVGSRL